MSQNADLLSVLANYNLGPILAIKISPSTSTGSSYLVKTTNGEYVLKRHASPQNIENLQAEKGILAFLNSHHTLLTPHLVADSSGQCFVSLRNRFWSLYEYIESDPAFDWLKVTWNAEHCLTGGQALAELHATLAPLTNMKHVETTNGPVLNILPNMMDFALSRLAKSPHHKLLPAPLLHSLPLAITSLVKQIRDLEARLCLEPILIHGDYHPGNVLFANGRPCAILDFEYAHVDSPFVDIAYAALIFCRTWSVNSVLSEQAVQQPLNMDFLSKFIGGYQKSLVSSQLVSVFAEHLLLNSILAAYMKLSCHLLIAWFIDRLLTDPKCTIYISALSCVLAMLPQIDIAMEEFHY